MKQENLIPVYLDPETIIRCVEITELSADFQNRINAGDLDSLWDSDGKLFMYDNDGKIHKHEQDQA